MTGHLRAFRTVRYRFQADDGHVFAVAVYTLVNDERFRQRPLTGRTRWRERHVWLEVQADTRITGHASRQRITFDLDQKHAAWQMRMHRARFIGRETDNHEVDWWGWKKFPDPRAAAAFQAALEAGVAEGNPLAIAALALGR